MEYNGSTHWIKSMLEFETDIILCVSIRFDMILQTSLTIILRRVIVYCLVLAKIRKQNCYEQIKMVKANQIQKPITMQLIQTLYFQFNDDFHYTILFYRLQTIPSIVLLVTILEVLSNSLSISTHRAFHCSQIHFMQIRGFSFNTHKSNPNSEFHFHSLPLTHYSSTN